MYTLSNNINTKSIACAIPEIYAVLRFKERSYHKNSLSVLFSVTNLFGCKTIVALCICLWVLKLFITRKWTHVQNVVISSDFWKPTLFFFILSYIFVLLISIWIRNLILLPVTLPPKVNLDKVLCTFTCEECYLATKGIMISVIF